MVCNVKVELVVATTSEIPPAGFGYFQLGCWVVPVLTNAVLAVVSVQVLVIWFPLGSVSIPLSMFLMFPERSVTVSFVIAAVFGSRETERTYRPSLLVKVPLWVE